MNRTELALLVLSFLLTGVLFGQIKASQSPKEPHRLATLAQQKMCDEKAKKKFSEDNPHPNPMTSYTSHYDAIANVCYVMVHHVSVLSSGKPVFSDVVYDAFEGRVYARYVWLNVENKKNSEVTPTECWVKPLGKTEKQPCSSSDEFEELVDKYFGIGM